MLISSMFQLITFGILAYLSSIGTVTLERKQRMDRLNSAALTLSMLTTLINIAIVSFSRKTKSPYK